MSATSFLGVLLVTVTVVGALTTRPPENLAFALVAVAALVMTLTSLWTDRVERRIAELRRRIGG